MLHDGKENVNIGLLGHVDCGKTSLGKVFKNQIYRLNSLFSKGAE